MRLARAGDINLLLDLMDEFYAEAGYRLNRNRASVGFNDLLEDGRLGWIWMIQAEGRDVGYAVTTFRYSMEYCGRMAAVDDLYVRPEWRNRGVATEALIEIRNFLKSRGIRAVTVEVGQENGSAQSVYRKAGLAAIPDRRVFACELAAPAHIVSDTPSSVGS
ncbi:MAG TPA: GNAT family N-acetyltransferase [Bryobacteraceae bacterium]|nr:GNAT family N-acetyltransferase [Bryobacteraceae bacterium]